MLDRRSLELLFITIFAPSNSQQTFQDEFKEITIRYRIVYPSLQDNWFLQPWRQKPCKGAWWRFLNVGDHLLILLTNDCGTQVATMKRLGNVGRRIFNYNSFSSPALVGSCTIRTNQRVSDLTVHRSKLVDCLQYKASESKLVNHYINKSHLSVNEGEAFNPFVRGGYLSRHQTFRE